MELTTLDVIEVEKHLKEHKGKVYLFAPRDVRQDSDYEPELYLAWCRGYYPDIVFKYTHSMGSLSMDAKVTEYLTIKWEMRNTSLGIIRHDLIRLRNEIGPLQKIKQTLACLRKAQFNVQIEMDKLRI